MFNEQLELFLTGCSEERREEGEGGEGEWLGLSKAGQGLPISLKHGQPIDSVNTGT